MGDQEGEINLEQEYRDDKARENGIAALKFN